MAEFTLFNIPRACPRCQTLMKPASVPSRDSDFVCAMCNLDVRAPQESQKLPDWLVEAKKQIEGKEKTDYGKGLGYDPLNEGVESDTYGAIEEEESFKGRLEDNPGTDDTKGYDVALVTDTNPQMVSGFETLEPSFEGTRGDNTEVAKSPKTPKHRSLQLVVKNSPRPGEIKKMTPIDDVRDIEGAPGSRQDQRHDRGVEDPRYPIGEFQVAASFQLCAACGSSCDGHEEGSINHAILIAHASGDHNSCSPDGCDSFGKSFHSHVCTSCGGDTPCMGQRTASVCDTFDGFCKVCFMNLAGIKKAVNNTELNEHMRNRNTGAPPVTQEEVDLAMGPGHSLKHVRKHVGPHRPVKGSAGLHNITGPDMAEYIKGLVGSGVATYAVATLWDKFKETLKGDKKNSAIDGMMDLAHRFMQWANDNPSALLGVTQGPAVAGLFKAYMDKRKKKSSFQKHAPYGIPKEKGGDNKKNVARMEKCVEKVMAEGHDKASAIAICKESLGFTKGSNEERCQDCGQMKNVCGCQQNGYTMTSKWNIVSTDEDIYVPEYDPADPRNYTTEELANQDSQERYMEEAEDRSAEKEDDESGSVSVTSPLTEDSQKELMKMLTPHDPADVELPDWLREAKIQIESANECGTCGHGWAAHGKNSPCSCCSNFKKGSKEESSDSFVPPSSVASNAKRGLKLRKQYGRGGTEIGVARARDLSNRKGLSYSTVKRMKAYFDRHEVDKKGEGWGKDSAGYIAWLLWGGDAGRSWANKIVKSKEKKSSSDIAFEEFNRLSTRYAGEVIDMEKYRRRNHPVYYTPSETKEILNESAEDAYRRLEFSEEPIPLSEELTQKFEGLVNRLKTVVRDQQSFLVSPEALDSIKRKTETPFYDQDAEPNPIPNKPESGPTLKDKFNRVLDGLGLYEGPYDRMMEKHDPKHRKSSELKWWEICSENSCNEPATWWHPDGIEPSFNGSCDQHKCSGCIRTRTPEGN